MAAPCSSNEAKLTPPFDDQRVLMSCDDMPEPHAADGVGCQPGLHPDLDANAVQRQLAAERAVGSRNEVRGAAGEAGHRGVVA